MACSKSEISEGEFKFTLAWIKRDLLAAVNARALSAGDDRPFPPHVPNKLIEVLILAGVCTLTKLPCSSGVVWKSSDTAQWVDTYLASIQNGVDEETYKAIVEAWAETLFEGLAARKTAFDAAEAQKAAAFMQRLKDNPPPVLSAPPPHKRH